MTHYRRPATRSSCQMNGSPDIERQIVVALAPTLDDDRTEVQTWYSLRGKVRLRRSRGKSAGLPHAVPRLRWNRRGKSPLTYWRAANGIPLNAVTPCSSLPRTAPLLVFTISSFIELFAFFSSVYQSRAFCRQSKLLYVHSYKSGRCQPPKTVSRCCATASATSSRQGLATTCIPMGNPSGDVPPRTATPGHPVRL
jgi:hypothetical protein